MKFGWFAAALVTSLCTLGCVHSASSTARGVPPARPVRAVSVETTSAAVPLRARTPAPRPAPPPPPSPSPAVRPAPAHDREPDLVDVDDVRFWMPTE